MSYQQDELAFLEYVANRIGVSGTCREVFIARFQNRYGRYTDQEIALKVLNVTPYQVRDNLKKICKAIAKEFSVDYGKTQRGQWKQAKSYLVDSVYPQWKQPTAPWQRLREKAHDTLDWLQFTSAQERGIVVPPGQNTLQSNTPYLLQVNLQNIRGDFLLLNQGLNTKYVLSPSLAFAPRCQLTGKVVWLPQEAAMCPDIKFDSRGREEFLAIATEKPLGLSWLHPREDNPAPSWDEGRLQEVWEALQGQRWQAFYCWFNVV